MVKIELYHASKFGNGGLVAEELRRVMEAKGLQITVHHIDDPKPREMSSADPFALGSPTRFGGPKGSIHRLS